MLPKPTNFFPEPPLMTVTEYRMFVNQLLGAVAVLVEGEVSNYREITGRPYCYFDIKDNQTVAKCFQAFRNCSPIKLKNGIKIKVHGYPNQQKNGSLVIDIRQIFLSGQGELMEAFNRLKAKLEKEGLFDHKLKKPLPVFPRRIGLVAGKNSSAYHDVTAELAERWGGLKIYFLPAKVQGVNSSSEIVRAIQWLNRTNPVDLLIIARGGGSLEDLQAFNSEEVVREIFASKIPVVSAIGHEDHWTLSDYVADQRAKTPTKAAQIAVPDRHELLDRLEYYSDRMESLIRHQLQGDEQRLQTCLSQISRLLKNTVSIRMEKFSQLDQRMVRAIRWKFRTKMDSLQQLEFRLTRTMKDQQRRSQVLLDAVEKQLQLLDPLQVLKRGYCVAEKGSQRVTSINQVAIGDQIALTLPDGLIGAIVEEKNILDE